MSDGHLITRFGGIGFLVSYVFSIRGTEARAIHLLEETASLRFRSAGPIVHKVDDLDELRRAEQPVRKICCGI